MSGTRPDIRATRLETVGAWLHLWTPRRDTYVPPAPWREIAIAAVLVLAGATVAVAILSHDASKSNARRAATERVKLTATARRERARLKVEQRARVGHVAARPPSRAAQAATLTALEHSITADAQARFKHGKLDS